MLGEHSVDAQNSMITLLCQMIINNWSFPPLFGVGKVSSLFSSIFKKLTYEMS